jgi:hypothetical protein
MTAFYLNKDDELVKAITNELLSSLRCPDDDLTGFGEPIDQEVLTVKPIIYGRDDVIGYLSYITRMNRLINIESRNRRTNMRERRNIT